MSNSKNNNINNAAQSHPLANVSDEDDFSNLKTNSKDKNEVNEKPIIPPRNKIKTQSTINYDSTNRLSCLNNEEFNNKNYCQKQLNRAITLLNIDPLSIQPHAIRWFYKEDQTSSKWQPFNGLDSLSIECEYLFSKQNNNLKSSKLVQVLNRLFEVNILERKCSPIYWEGLFYYIL